MKNRMGIIILTLACVGLAITLIVNQSNATKSQKLAESTIVTQSNGWVEAEGRLEEERKLTSSLTNDLASRAKTRFAVGTPGWVKADDIITAKPPGR